MTDPRVELVLHEFLEAQDAGNSPDAKEFIARHPALATELSDYFDATGRVESTARFLSPAIPPDMPAGVPGFQILEPIGWGAMSVVYKAFQPELGRTVALKFLRTDDRAVLGRLIGEARAAARLDHPGIVPIFEVGEHAGRPFLAMAYVPGETLAARIARGPVPPKDAARIVRAVAVAVQHAHDHGVIHRDLKPANILLTADGQPKVTDFGLARRSGEETLTSAGDVLGTPAYMPPEFAVGGATAAGPAADVYSLGAVLYAMLTGRPPFVGDTVLETILQVTHDEPVPPRERNSRVDRGIQAICQKCLEKNPKHRYGSASALADDLDRYLRDESPHAEQLGWGEWARRQLDRAVDFGHAQRWSKLLHVLVGVVLLAHVAFLLGTQSANSGWVFWASFLGMTLVTTWIPCVWVASHRRLDPREREILLFWLGVSIGQVILFADRCPLIGPASAADVYRYFPASLVLFGVMLFAEGRFYWGRLYLFGLATFVVAALLMFAIDYAPIVAGGCQAGVYLAIARHLGRVASEWSARGPGTAHITNANSPSASLT